MDYIVEGITFGISYKEIKELHEKHCSMSDEEFIKNLPSAIHLACIICFFKEIPTSVCLSDTGIVHELAHLIHIPDEPVASLKEIRELFKNQLKLS